MDFNTTVPYWNPKDFENVTNDAGTTFDKQKETFVYSAGFLCTVLFVAVVLRESLKKFHFPHTVLLFVFGAVLGFLDHNFVSFREFTAFGKNQFVMQLFLPVIIYDYSFGMNPHMFVMAVTQCIILALPGFVFCAGLTAVFAKTVLTLYNWDWLVCILFGTILTATDPSAVIDILKDYGVSASLITIIEGEAMLNSGIALVVSKTLLRSFETEKFDYEDVILYVGQCCLGAVAFGYIVSMGIIAILRRSENDTDMEVTFTFCTVYITYFLSEILLDVSGILAVVVLGVSLSSYNSSMNYEEEETTAHQFWQTLSFWASSLIFTIVGLLITSSAFINFDSSDIGFIIASYFMICFFRGCMILVLAPLLRICGYGFTWKCGAMLTWGGMRGAIGLALALLTRQTRAPDVLNKLMIQVAGVIVLTLIFNASTMHWLLKFLGIGQITDKNIESMAHTVTLLRDAVQTTEKVIRMDKYLVGADWAWVHRMTQIENPYEKKASAYSTMMKRAFETFRGHCKECDAEIQIEPNARERMQMEAESRLLILRALMTSVTYQHKDYGILRRTLGHLNTHIENVLDTPDKHLSAEDVKKKFLKISYYVKFLKRHMMRAMHKLDIKNKQIRIQEHLLIEENDVSAFRKKCIKVYRSRRFETVMYWTLVVNVIPIAGEFMAVFTEYRLFYSSVRLEKEILFFEVLNGILALFYVWDAVIKIGALGCKRYFKDKGNVIDFTVTVTAVAQIVYGIVLISTYRYTYSWFSLYVLISMSAVRLLCLMKIICAGIFTNILNQFCSAFYNAFDLVIGFIVANEEIAKSAHKILDHEECAENARLAAENNIYEMLCYADKIEKEHPYVACAWRTHRATIYILRNMKEFIEEMINIYMIDETDAEQLLEEIESKMKETLGLPRYMKAKEGIRNSLKNVQWIRNEEMLNKIMENHTIKSFSGDEVIQDAGRKHTDMKILHKGIIQISGSSTGEKTNILPNTDSVRYFDGIGNFLVHTNSPQTVGLLGYLLQTPSITRVASSSDCQLISISFETISQIENQFRSLSFHMWRPLALQIALAVLSEEQAYENWTDEKLKIHLEEGILPNLEGRVEFDVPAVIADMVLVQGKIQDKKTDTVYVGPAYIPNTVRSLKIRGNPRSRPRIVMVFLREEKFHASTIMGWAETEEIQHIGLCLVHGIRRMSAHDTQLSETSGRRMSFIQTLGQLFRPSKSENILESDAP